MKEIVIRELTLLNFKGIRNLTVRFDEHETNIYGENGSGKTTVFDAFTWLLFGKDSTDRKDFNIKTLDENNVAIERIPHEVSACISVNGDDITLKKCYNENWTKKRGSAVETFNGHSVECFYNDVPCSVSEYAKKIAEICDEQVFKLITNPLYFTSQKKDFQRSMLFNLAGNVTNDEIVAEHPEFSILVGMLTGKTLEEYKREVQSKKRKIKDGIDGIPARIDEQKRDMPDTLDWAKLEAEIAQQEQDIVALESQIADRSKAYEEVTKRKQEIARQLSIVKSDITERMYAVEAIVLADYRKARKAYDDAQSRIRQLRNEKNYKKVAMPRLERELADLNLRRSNLLEEWKSFKASTITFNEEEFICPTCRRPLEVQDIDIKKAEMENEFNEQKAKKLERNKSMGIETKAAIEAKTAEIEALKNDLFKLDEEIARLEAAYPESSAPQEPDTKPAINADEEVMTLRKKRDNLQSQLDEEVQAPDTRDISDKIRLLRDSIGSNKMWLADRERIANKQKRIAELEKEYTESQAQLADLEGIEFSIQQFGKARIEQVESRINGMFSVVRFKMFEQQINGGEIETCEAMVNGVPFSDLNNAMKINAGLDIINAISRANGITAPIFIDNRESVSEIGSVLAQIVNLIVDASCKTLKIE